MDGLFDSAWLKWGRAVVHAEALVKDISRVTTDPDRPSDFTFGYEYNARRHGFVVDVARVEPLPPAWSLMLGDVAANLRSALEHLAWGIVARGRRGKRGLPLTNDEARGVSFPIYGERRQFNGEVDRKLIGADRGDVARVRRVQPYHRGRRGKSRHALFILSALCNADKHRAIEPIRVVPSAGSYQVLEMRDCVPTADSRIPRPRFITLEVGAELGVVRVRKTGPNPHVELDAQLVLRLGVTDRIPLDEWLATTVRLIGLLLSYFAEAPDELAELGNPALFFPPDDPRSRADGPLHGEGDDGP
jgi:hypothetical protein